MNEQFLSPKDNAKEIARSMILQKKQEQADLFRKVSSLVGLIFIIFFFAIVTGSTFLTSSNIVNLLNQCFTLVIVSVGISYVYAVGGMDLSIGSIIGISSLVGAYCWIQPNLPFIVGFIAAMATGMLATLVTSGIHVIAKVPLFVASLCVKYIATGIVTTAVSKSDIFIEYTRFSFLNNGLVKLVILIIILVFGYFTFERTRIGKEMKAIGGNKTMAYQTGVKVKSRIIQAYLILGALIGVVSMFALSRVGNVNAATGVGTEFDAMTAIVLGGFPIQGGSKSRLSSAIIGALTVSVLTNGLTLWGVNPYLIYGIKGLLFLLIIGVSYERRKGAIVA